MAKTQLTAGKCTQAFSKRVAFLSPAPTSFKDSKMIGQPRVECLLSLITVSHLSWVDTGKLLWETRALHLEEEI